MKKANILCLLSAALITASCSTDFLNTKSQTEIMAEDIWKEKNLAEAYMYDICRSRNGCKFRMVL